MNELELLERFREKVPEPDELWWRHVRGQLVDPTRSVSDDRRSSPRHPRRHGSMLIGAAAAVALLITVGSVFLPIDGPAGPDPAVAQVLRRFSRIAAHAPSEEPPRDGQFVYWKTVSTATNLFFPGPRLDPFAYRIPVTEERWVGLDGSGRTIDRWGDPVFLTESDRLAYEAFLGTEEAASWGEFDWGRTYEERYRPGELGGADVPDVSQLPTNPDLLLRELQRQEAIGGSNGDWGVFTHAVDLLSISYMSPELRSAFYEAMSAIPGTEMIGLVRDDLGRHGIAIGHTRDDVREEVIFDRKSGDILSKRTVRLVDDPDAGQEVGQNVCCGEFAWTGTEAGTRMFSITYLSDGEVVDTVHERP
jgi:hypothetical protein